MASNKKREREPDVDAISPSSAGASTTTNFRNVSACNRCRNRKNRCDQKLPKCTNCEKANVRCVGFDPISKREIPRSYVYYLETRVRNLEAILLASNIAFPPPEEDFAISEAIKPGVNVPYPIQDEEQSGHNEKASSARAPVFDARPTLDPALKDRDEDAKLNNLVDNIGMVSVHGAGNPRYSTSASATGISFATVVYAAVKRSKDHTPTPSSEQSGGRNSRKAQPDGVGGGMTIRDSFFGLSCRSTVKPAPFPDQALGRHFVELYFEHANPQIPVLHRGEFMALFERVYASEPKKRTARELYMLNIVFAIGSGIIITSGNTESMIQTGSDDPDVPGKKRQKTMSEQQYQPEEYHSSAIVHLENFLGSSATAEGVGGGLEELQAVCLLAGLALLRPVAPGLWYIIGVAVRLSIDLGLHSEDVDPDLDDRALHPDVDESANGLGRKQWTRDLRRRLWWCVFNLDRLVSSCVGRPVSIYEATVTTQFPSLLSDEFITPAGFLKPPSTIETPTYKLVTQHYLRLRLLQSEILQVFQHRQADGARQLGAHRNNRYIIPDLKSAFLQRFSSFREWRMDIDRRLREWKESAPQQYDTGVAFTPLFLDLNYWQAIILLYRQSLSVPEQLASELHTASPGDDVQSPGTLNQEREEDKQMVFLKVAQAGQTVLKIYRQLHRLKRVSYTFLATHHLFMSGISFLYAIWHSTSVRSQLTIDDVDFTVLAATSVLSDLAEKCQPAEACREAFVRMAKATISMVMNTTSFGNASILGAQRLSSDPEMLVASPPSSIGQQRSLSEDYTAAGAGAPALEGARQLPKFDMHLKDLFSDEELASRPTAQRAPQYHALPRKQQQQQQQRDLRSLRVDQPMLSPSTSNPYSPSAPQNISPYQHQAQPAYQHLPTDSAQQAPPDYAFANDMDFLQDFSISNDDLWGSSVGSDLDLGAFAGNGSGGGVGFDYEASGEIFDTFFFGNNGDGF